MLELHRGRDGLCLYSSTTERRQKSCVSRLNPTFGSTRSDTSGGTHTCTCSCSCCWRPDAKTKLLPPAEQAPLHWSFTTSDIDLLINFFTGDPPAGNHRTFAFLFHCKQVCWLHGMKHEMHFSSFCNERV